MTDEIGTIWIVIGEDEAGKWEMMVAHSDLEDAEKFAASIRAEHYTVTINESVLW